MDGLRVVAKHLFGDASWDPRNYMGFANVDYMPTKLVPTLYLAAFVWENVMLTAPEATRFIILGAILVSVMIARPSGILGERRVEIV